MNIRTIVAIPLLLSGSGWAVAEDFNKHRTDAATVVSSLFGDLKDRLGSAMAAGGPAHAIAVCNEDAIPLTEKVSAATPWTVGRTSLRLRNPDNRPDEWERQVLEQFEARRAAGEDVRDMTHIELVERDGRREVRFMKAIPTAEACLACHGSNLGADVQQRLDALYPQDLATGFAQGDIRGAFTLYRPE